MTSTPRLLTRTVAALALLLTTVACSNDPQGAPAPGDDEQDVTAVAREEVTNPCPEQLPVMPHKPARGPAPARVLPTLPADVAAPDQAWVCRYIMTKSVPVDGARGPLTLDWNLTKEKAVPVSAGDLSQVGDVVREFGPANDAPLIVRGPRGCPDNLGSRWLLVYSVGDELTGIVTDDFGCQGVGITDDPAISVPMIDHLPLVENRPMRAPKGFVQVLEGLHAAA